MNTHSLSPVLLIVDDEKNTRDGLRSLLEDDYDVYVAPNIKGAMNILESESVDLVLTDLRLGSEDGMNLIERARQLQNPPICIMMTAYGSVDLAVEAMKHGAYDFITKPINLDRLEILIRRALRSRKIEEEHTALLQQVDKKFGLENLIGESAAMQEVFDTIRQVAPSRATVLIQGESGTGKELVAHAIHNLSNRSKATFVPVHCMALSPQILESELFGHEKGAFTGATERRIGRFEQAHNGTLFLDEIGEIDASTQIKILRFLGERTFERVGGNQPIQVDVRLVAATNKDLETLVEEGTFREDLFFRLNVVQIHLPPLRERPEDIPLMVQHFIRESCKENEKPKMDITSEAMNTLLRYPWPGNVRELRSAIEHGVVMANGPKITLRELPQKIRQSNGNPISPSLPANNPSSSPFDLQTTEKQLIIRALEESQGNRTEAAKKLGISRRTLHRRLQEFKNSD